MGQSFETLIYQVAVGEVQPFWEDCIRSVSRYCERHGHDHVVQRQPVLKIAPVDSARSVNALRLGYLPILEKSNALNYLNYYEQVLVLDADVYVREDAPDIFRTSTTPFAGVIEREMPLTVQYRDKIRKYSKGQFERLNTVNWHWNDEGAEFFNMGVMLLDSSILPFLEGQTPQQFLRRPEFERFINGEGHWKWSTDQTLLNWWIKHSGISVTHLNWRWNALYGAVQDVSEAHFVHFFLAAKMDHRGGEIPEIIKGL